MECCSITTIQEKLLQERIDAMKAVGSKGLSIPIIKKDSIEKIHVLFALHNSLPYDKAGYAIRTHMLATNLKLKGIDVVPVTRPGYPWDLKKHQQRDKVSINSIDNIQYIRLLDNQKNFKQGSDFNYIDNYRDELIKVTKKRNSTIIHAHSNYLNGLAAIKAANALKISSIYEIRGLWHVTRLTLDANYKYAGMFDYEQEMEKAAAQAADVVVTISYALKQLLQSWDIEESKIEVIPNAVDTTLFREQAPSQRLIRAYGLKDKVVVGYVGSLTGYEGLEELVQAMNQLIDDGLDIVLMIVGDGRHKKRLETLAKSKRIIFTGRVPFEEVEEYYSLFDICPFPRNNYEVCQYVPPLKILEAMAMKKSIIVSNVAPLLEIIEDNKNGLVCQADSVENLKEAIFKLYSDKELRKVLSQNAYNWVLENRTWNKMSQKYKVLYEGFKYKNE